ncbi:uncharacterized protein LOC132067650 [Lycium ferocissimum]|uniref:uncharacterized protein LOC132067650 n=1 Tax=Lycium ferocissimum TaxID=112874 RepID=UPI002814C624|nr:uncharacterized protein LOC132067650 [Lycium ferocissimum]
MGLNYRGLRQGDPMSQLLFVLVMEYLSSVLKCMSNLPDFQYHPMCKHIKLTHLIFVDDLMIFCKGDASSVARVMEALIHCSAVTGLVANVDKSSLFIAGVEDDTKEQLLGMTGFSLGQFPIRHLGLPLSSKKWNKLDCQQLIDKITHKIQSGYSKQLSYTGRLQVVNAVLLLYIVFGAHWYWQTINALKSVMQNWYTQGRYNLTHSGKYSITASYNAMLGNQTRLRIADLVWTSVAQPRHRMIVCQAMETSLYLFAECGWLKQVRDAIVSWAGILVHRGEVKQVLETIRRKHWKQFYKEVVAAIWGAVL